MATQTMAAWRDLPPHTAAPPDGGHSVTMAHHVGQARCVRGGGILLFFRGQGRRVISSLTHVDGPCALRFLLGGCHGCSLPAQIRRGGAPRHQARKLDADEGSSYM
jgi:hypothetical protein